MCVGVEVATIASSRRLCMFLFLIVHIRRLEVFRVFFFFFVVWQLQAALEVADEGQRRPRLETTIFVATSRVWHAVNVYRNRTDTSVDVTPDGRVTTVNLIMVVDLLFVEFSCCSVCLCQNAGVDVWTNLMILIIYWPGLACLTKPCKNGATCTDEKNGDFTCACLPGYNGKRCEASLDAHLCDNNPCKNSGICSLSDKDYKCECLPGWTGKNCEINYNECSSNPCKNGGICYDGINNYTCKCDRTG